MSIFLPLHFEKQDLVCLLLKSFYHFLNLKSRNCIKSSFLKLMVLSLMTTNSFSQVSKELLPKTKKKNVLTLIEDFDFSCPLSAQSSKSLRSFKEKVGDRVLIERRSLSFSKNDLSWIEYLDKTNQDKDENDVRKFYTNLSFRSNYQNNTLIKYPYRTIRYEWRKFWFIRSWRRRACN